MLILGIFINSLNGFIAVRRVSARLFNVLYFLTRKMQLKFIKQLPIKSKAMYNLTKELKENINNKDKIEIDKISKKYRIAEEKVHAVYTRFIRRGRTKTETKRIINGALSGEPTCLLF